MTIEDKGLPFHKNPYKFGNLFVLFKVIFPESMGPNQIKQVNSTFADMKKKKSDENMVADTV